MGVPAVNSDGAGTWRRLSVQGNPGNSIRFTLRLRDLNQDGPDNDFGTDDVALMLSRADIRATLTGPTMLGASGQSGGYTVTFSNSGPQANVTRAVALPAGATLTAAQRAALSGTTFYNRGLNTITFQPVPILGSDSTTTFKFSSPAPTVLGPYSPTSTVATSTPHDGGTAPDQTTMAVNVMVADFFVTSSDGNEVPTNATKSGNVVLNGANPANLVNTDFNAQLVAAPAHGTVVLKADGRYSYTPTATR